MLGGSWLFIALINIQVTSATETSFRGKKKLFTLISSQLHIHMVPHEEEAASDSEECSPWSGPERELQYPDQLDNLCGSSP